MMFDTRDPSASNGKIREWTGNTALRKHVNSFARSISNLRRLRLMLSLIDDAPNFAVTSEWFDGQVLCKSHKIPISREDLQTVQLCDRANEEIGVRSLQTV